MTDAQTDTYRTIAKKIIFEYENNSKRVKVVEIQFQKYHAKQYIIYHVLVTENKKGLETFQDIYVIYFSMET